MPHPHRFSLSFFVLLSRRFISDSCYRDLISFVTLIALAVAPVFAGHQNIDDNKDVVVFYLDSQYQPIVKLELLGKMSEGMKAVLAMYAFQVGGGCAGHDEHGLKCELTKSLGLGAQCSGQHLGLVRSWFTKGIPPISGYPEHSIQQALKSGDLKSICYSAPYTATRQVIWEFIRVKKENNRVFVDAISHWTASADGPGGRYQYQSEYRIGAGTIVVVAHKKSPLPQNDH